MSNDVFFFSMFLLFMCLFCSVVYFLLYYLIVFVFYVLFFCFCFCIVFLFVYFFGPMSKQCDFLTDFLTKFAQQGQWCTLGVLAENLYWMYVFCDTFRNVRNGKPTKVREIPAELIKNLIWLKNWFSSWGMTPKNLTNLLNILFFTCIYCISGSTSVISHGNS